MTNFLTHQVFYGEFMLPCIFLRINDQIYNANCIKEISFNHTPSMSKHGPIIKVIILFNDYMDISPKHFFTYYQDLGQIFYDWQHSKNSFFEIPYLTTEDVEKMSEEYLKDEFN